MERKLGRLGESTNQEAQPCCRRYGGGICQQGRQLERPMLGIYGQNAEQHDQTANRRQTERLDRSFTRRGPL